VITYAFAGQGAQHIGMGSNLFARYPDMVRAADDVLGYSIEELCLSSDGRLNQTEFTQPAIFVVNALDFRAAYERIGLAPDFVVGHSVGELSALYAAGVYDFETGLSIVQERGMLMSRCQPPGAMAALIGERAALRAFISDPTHGVFLATDNGPTQIVVAGTRQAIERLSISLDRLRLGRAVLLPVSGAFHSPLMQEARLAFDACLQPRIFATPSVPIIANLTARPYATNEIRRHLVDHLVSPVRWHESITYLAAIGPMLFQDLGPGRVVSSLIRQIIDDMSSIDAPNKTLTDREIRLHGGSDE
jgi:malonyl CoA-acyl carrier protein transacylase